ncbi:MAG: RidA family protein [Bacillota bacterium]
MEDGYQAARLAMLNCLAETKSVLGTLDKIKRIVKVTGYVASAESFTDQPKVINGASELLIEIWANRDTMLVPRSELPRFPAARP